jgi:hypothetical protein
LPRWAQLETAAVPESAEQQEHDDNDEKDGDQVHGAGVPSTWQLVNRASNGG